MINLVKNHCTDERWREVFLLTTSMLPDASQFMMTFRCGVNELLGGDEKLKALLVWADKKSAPIQEEPWLVRPNYLFVELFYRSKSYALSLAINRARDRTRTLSRALTLDLDLDRALTLALDRALARDVGLNKLAKELAAPSLSSSKATTAQWHDFADKLRPFMIKHRDIGHDWDLTATQEARLVNYLDATHLFQDCLELATMRPYEKQAMLNSLYLPPAQADEGQSA